MDESLEILIRQCQNNKKSAQAEIYKLFSAKLFSVCLRYSNCYEDAQDGFQDGFILIFKKINQFRFEGSFEGWIRRIMVNTCIERLRTRNHLYVINEEITPDAESEEIDSNEIELEPYSYNDLLGFVQQLPDRYRQVFNLYVIEEYSHQEIADLLQISIGTSKSNLSRAREKLKSLVKKNNTPIIMSK
ncbi:MAG: RNA polymerase sigma factor [Moheibacter sp.]